jgi:RNA polymerase sigma-70 factor, ECF subfamily
MIVLVLPDSSQDMIVLNRAYQGDKQAVASLYRQYLESIYQFVRLRVGEQQTAEDITSTVFTKFVLAIKKQKGPRQSVRAWLFQVARNEIYRHYGKTEPLPIETLDQWFKSDDNTPEEYVLADDRKQATRRAIRMLSADQQEVLLLRFDQQLSVQATADVMGKNINTVKTLQHRALLKLRQIIKRDYLKE